MFHLTYKVCLDLTTRVARSLTFILFPLPFQNNMPTRRFAYQTVSIPHRFDFRFHNSVSQKLIVYNKWILLLIKKPTNFRPGRFSTHSCFLFDLLNWFQVHLEMNHYWFDGMFLFDMIFIDSIKLNNLYSCDSSL